jgi:hypothetical protein
VLCVDVVAECDRQVGERWERGVCAYVRLPQQQLKAPATTTSSATTRERQGERGEHEHNWDDS